MIASDAYEHAPLYRETRHTVLNKMARYMTNASTIRAYLANRFPDDPKFSLAHIEQVMAVMRPKREPVSDKSLGYNPETDTHFRVRGINQRKPRAVKKTPFNHVKIAEPDNPFLASYGVALAVIKMVAPMFGVSVAEIMGQRRLAQFTHPRALVSHLLYKWGYSYPQIGAKLGGRDHSTIINAVKKLPIYERFGDGVVAREKMMVLLNEAIAHRDERRAEIEAQSSNA